MKKFSLIALLIIPIIIKGQDVHLSQFTKSSFLLNPSSLGFQKNDYKMILQRKSQWESVAIPYKTFLLSLERKDFIFSHSIGVQFLNDVAGDAEFKTSGLSIIYNKTILINSKTILNGGVGAGIFQRSISFEKLIFNDPENYRNVSFWYPDYNIGMSNKYNINKKMIIKSGIAFFHLNRAKQSLLENENIRLKQKTVFHIEGVYLVGNKTKLSSKMYCSNQDKEKEKVFAFDIEYIIHGEKPIALKSGISNRLADAIIYNFGVEINNFDFMISYDFNISSLHNASNYKGGVEISLLYTWDIKEKEKTMKLKKCQKYL